MTDIWRFAETRYEDTSEVRDCGSKVRVQPGQEAEGRDEGWWPWEILFLAVDDRTNSCVDQSGHNGRLGGRDWR